MEGAQGILIVFDPLSRTEYNYDYLQFYKDDSHTDRWGDEKYSGRDSNTHWAGVGDVPCTVLESSANSMRSRGKRNALNKRVSQADVDWPSELLHMITDSSLLHDITIPSSVCFRPVVTTRAPCVIGIGKVLFTIIS